MIDYKYCFYYAMVQKYERLYSEAETKECRLFCLDQYKHYSKLLNEIG